ncbi:FG-GAP repeat domain-containing protein, partial [Bizionia paragorgiae]
MKYQNTSKIKKLLSIITLCFMFFNHHSFAQDIEVNLMTVTNAVGKSHPDLLYWRDAGVSLTGRQDTYLAIVSEPAKDKVKKVVFIAAGQQSDSPFGSEGLSTGNYGNGYTNVLTGQPNNYKEGIRKTTNLQATRTLNNLSLASKLINSGKFPKESTLFVLVFDANFGYFRDQDEKGYRENAFFNFLTSKFNPSNVETIILAGQSRGGALVFRLGSRLRRDSSYSKIPLIVQGYDPVATNPVLANSNANVSLRKTSIEKYLPIHSKNDKLINPHDNSKYCWKVDMDITFPQASRDNLLVYIVHSGDVVSDKIHKSIRAFAWKEKNTVLDWYKQHWLNLGHEEMGSCNYFNDGNCLYKTVESGYQHIVYAEFKYEVKERFGNAVSSFKGTLNSANVDKGNGHFIVGVSDVNGDKKADLISVHSNGNAYVWKGDANGKFSNATASFNGTLNSANVGGGNGHFIVGISDVNGDGRADLVTVSKNGKAYVYRGGKDYKFSQGVSSFNGTLNSANVDGGNGHFIVG